MISVFNLIIINQSSSIGYFTPFDGFYQQEYLNLIFQCLFADYDITVNWGKIGQSVCVLLVCCFYQPASVFGPVMCCSAANIRGGLHFCLSFLPFSFFFRWWYGTVCAPRRGRWLERKASGLILSHSSSSNKSPLSRAAFCVQSANRQPQIISHNSLLRKQEMLESPDDCEGAYMTEGEWEKETEREAHAGFCVFLSSSLVFLDAAERSEVICVFSDPLLRKRLLFIQTPFSQNSLQKRTTAYKFDQT